MQITNYFMGGLALIKNVIFIRHPFASCGYLLYVVRQYIMQGSSLNISCLPFQCSFHKCDRQVKNNFDGASEFYNDYGREIGQGFMCYFEPNSHDYAIVKVITKATVIHAMLWPSVAVIVAIIILGLNLSEKGQAARNSSQRNAHSSPTFDLRYPGHRVGVEYEIIES